MPELEKYRRESSDLKKQRKAAILDVAEALFIERGLAGVNIQDLSKACGISRVTFYRYFPDIHPLAMEVAARMMGQMYSAVIRRQGWLGQAPVEKGRAFTLIFFDGLIDAFEEITPQLKYMGIFDQFYSQAYPSQDLAVFYKNALKQGFAESHFYEFFKIHEWQTQDVEFFVVVGNLVFAGLEKLASRGQLLAEEQGVTVGQHLETLKQMLKALR